jgi:hypothetical protein
VTCSRVACVLLLPLALAHAAGALEPGKPLPPGPEGEILAAEALRQRALVDADLAALRELCGDELRFTHASGVVETKYVLLAALESGRLDYLAIKTSDEIVHVYGDAGVLTGNAIVHVKTADGSRRTIPNVYTAVYAKRDGAWRLVAYQSTSAAKAPAPAD